LLRFFQNEQNFDLVKKFYKKTSFIYISAICTFLLAAVFLRHNIFQFSIQTYLNFKSDQHKWCVNYSSVQFRKGIIKFYDLKIDTKDKTFQSSVDVLDVKFKHQKKFKFDLSLFFHEPNLSIRQDFKIGSNRSHFNLASISKVKIDAKDGKLNCFGNDNFKTLFFSLKSSDEPRALSTLYLSDSDQAGGLNQVVAKLFAWPEELMAEIDFQNTPLNFVDGLLKFLDSDDLVRWNFMKGGLNGRVWLSFSPNYKVRQLNVNLRASDVIVIQPEKGLSFDIGHLSFDVKYPKGMNDGSFLQNTALNLDIRSGKINCIDPTYNIDFQVADIQGSLNFHSFKDSQIALKANLVHKDQLTPILLSVNPSSLDKETLDVDLKVSETNLSTRLNLSIAKEEKDLLVVRGKIKEMDALEIGMLKHALGFFSREIKEFQILKGRVTSELSLRIVDGKLENVLLDDFIAEDLELLWKEKEIFASTNYLSGRATLNFKNFFTLEVPIWEVNIQNGKFIKSGKNSFQLDNLAMQLYMVRNVFEPSWMKATYEGIDLHFDVVGYYSEADLRLHLDTTGDKILNLFTQNEDVNSKFQNYKLHTDLKFSRQLGCWDVRGKSYLNLMEDLDDVVSFGFQLSDSIFEKQNWNEQAINCISKGFFETNLISSEFLKFLTACNKETWVYEGLCALKGSFSPKGLDATIALANGNFFSDILDIRLNPLSDNSKAIESIATFSLDFASRNWLLELFLSNALIHEKSKHLDFSETKALLSLNPNSIQLLKCETSLGSLHLAGSLLYQNGSFEISIDSFSSTVAEMKKILEKFEDRIQVPLPFDGLVRNKEGGVFVSYDPKNGLEALLHLELLHGFFDVNSSFTISELAFDFAFNSKDKIARITNLFGKIPSSYHLGGYFLNGREIQLCFDAEKRLDFDLRVENQFLDLARVYGAVDLIENKLILDLDKTHLFSTPLDEFELKISKEYSIESFKACVNMPLEDIHQYFMILSDMKLVKQEWIEIAREINVEEKHLKIEAKKKNEVFSILLNSEDFGCRLKNEGKKWELDEAHIFGLNLVGDIEKKEESILFHGFKAFHQNSSLEFGLGSLDLNKKTLTLPIINAVLDLADFRSDLAGARANLFGTIHWDYSAGIFESFSKAILKFEAERGDFRLKSIDDMNLILTLDKGLSLENSKIELLHELNSFTFDIASLSYCFRDSLLQGYKIKTSIGDKQLSWLLNQQGLSITEFQRKEAFSDLEFDIEYSQESFILSGSVSDGNYIFKGKEICLKDLRFFSDTNHMDISVVAPILNSQFRIHAKVYPDDMGLTLIEGFEEGVDERVFYADLKLFSENGPMVQKIEGNLFGLNFEFLPINKMDEWVFLGDVKIDADKLYPHVGKDIQELISELKFHKGYELKGEISIKKADLNQAFFKGYLKAREFDLAGYVFKTMLSEIYIDKKGLEIKDLKISDQGASIAIGKIKLDFSADGRVFMHIPEIKINELRPTLLAKRVGKQRLKPFCIKNMVLHDITGNASDEKSITGKGNLHFINTFKEGHKLIDIPIEIISRLGLDIGLLVPVQGELDFSIRNGKVVFTKLKNSFSESKRSYFYLWNKTESFIDFDGNMHIDIRMKQYVLFKITELFILSIQGSLDKPKCYLR
jgi:hypothetical protein